MIRTRKGKTIGWGRKRSRKADPLRNGKNRPRAAKDTHREQKVRKEYAGYSFCPGKSRRGKGKYQKEDVDNTVKFIFNKSGKLVSYQYQ